MKRETGRKGRQPSPTILYSLEKDTMQQRTYPCPATVFFLALVVFRVAACRLPLSITYRYTVYNYVCLYVNLCSSSANSSAEIYTAKSSRGTSLAAKKRGLWWSLCKTVLCPTWYKQREKETGSNEPKKNIHFFFRSEMYNSPPGCTKPVNIRSEVLKENQIHHH